MALVTSRYEEGPFQSAEELAQRVPSLDRKELTLFARIGALNWVDGIVHRRDALWQVTGKAGTDVQMRFGEILNADGTRYMDNLRNATRLEVTNSTSSGSGSLLSQGCSSTA